MSEVKEETKKCPSCYETISSKAKRCPHCRQDLRGWFRRHIILTILGILLISLSVLAGMGGSSRSAQYNSGKDGSTNTPAPERKENIEAYVNFDGTQFIISNIDKYTCQNARMQVNGDYALEGYNLESALDSIAKSGEAAVYKVGASQFTKKDGTRLNPFITKPQNFSISCRGNNELNSAFGYWEFK